MKKLISLILCVVVILTFAVPAFAADAAYNFAEDASMKYTIPTKYDSVLRSQTGEYAMICGDVIQPVGRMNLELSDESAVNRAHLEVRLFFRVGNVDDGQRGFPGDGLGQIFA